MIVKTKKVNLQGYKDYIRILSANAVMSLAEHSGKEVSNRFMFDILAESLCNKEGERIYTPEEVGELDFLTFKALIEKILKFNGLVNNQFKEAKDNLKKDQKE